MMRGLLFCSMAVVGCMALSCGTTKDTSSSSAEILVGLKRTPCHGRCPVYNLHVYTDGMATLNVGKFCDEAFGRFLSEGEHTAKVDVGIWGLVAEEAQSLGFDTLAHQYDDSRVMDLPSATVTIMGKSVMNRYGGPNLNDLYIRIERLVGQMDWQATPENAR